MRILPNNKYNNTYEGYAYGKNVRSLRYNMLPQNDQ